MTAELIDRPLRLSATHTAPNRLALAPMTNCLAYPTGEVSDADLRWIASKAKSGFGTLVTPGLSVAPEGQIRRRQPRIDDDRFLPGLARLAAAGPDAQPGALVLAQLLHGGLRVNPAWCGHGLQPVGPTDLGHVRGLSNDEVRGVIDAYVRAGVRAVAAGFTGVEVHAAHGYLPAQFISSEENTRRDHWGGSFENRARFTLEIVRGLRAALPETALVQVRISAEDMRQSRGIDLDESADLALLAAEAGADTVSLSVWDIHRRAQKYPDTTPVEYVKVRLGDRVPLIVAGKIWTAKDVALGFAQGADQLAIGRAAIFNRDAPTILRDSARTPLRPPATPEQLASQGVEPTFLGYLADKWGDLFVAPADECVKG